MENKYTKHFSIHFWGEMAKIGIIGGALGSWIIKSPAGLDFFGAIEIQVGLILMGLLSAFGWISLVVWVCYKIKDRIRKK